METISGKLLVSDEIYNKLLEKIMAGYWSAGERLPSEKQLCEMFSASRVSVRAALQRLQANGLTIATAESCTGGMIAQRLTNVSGASEVFGYGFVTYWEQAKAKLVGVDPAVIAQYNVVSAPVAAQMALGAAKAAGADIAVSVTGLAGPGGGDAVRPVGTVYLGAARGDKVYVKKLFVSRPDRALIRARAAQTALEMALRLAQGKTPAGTQVLAESAQHDPAALTALDETLRAE